jgi:hypothetical protein
MWHLKHFTTFGSILAESMVSPVLILIMAVSVGLMLVGAITTACYVPMEQS